MIKRHRLMVGLIVLLIAAVGVFFALRYSQAASASTKGNSEKGAAQEKRLPVEVVNAKRGTISSSIVTTASLEAYRQVTMIAEAQGVVEEFLVDEGNAVREGQVLARLRNADKQAALQKAEIHVRNAKIELDRKQRSYDQSLITAAEFDAARYAMDTAEAELKAAQVEVDHCMIRAPFSGTITERYIEKGQNVNPGQNLFTLVDRTPLRARIYLPEKEVFALKLDQPVDLSLNSQKDVAFKGVIRQINPAVDPRTGTVKVTVEIAQAPEQIRPGSFVDVQLVTQQHTDSLLVPKKAILEEAGEQYLFLINKGVATRKTVEIGFVNGQYAEVLSGVNAGDTVVIAGQGSLRDGSKTETVATR
ncbi:MAG: efflux RND transporter periplasmic adaptor subunit [Acidobacteriota bacterium]